MNWYECNEIENLKEIGSFKEVKRKISVDLKGNAKITARSWNELFEKVTFLRELFLTTSDIKALQFDNFSQWGKYFTSKKHEIGFMLLKHEGTVFDEELGIKKKHYIDKKAAKEWKSKYQLMFHPDKNIGDNSLDYVMVISKINKIYNRMVGKA